VSGREGGFRGGGRSGGAATGDGHGHARFYRGGCAGVERLKRRGGRVALLRFTTKAQRHGGWNRRRIMQLIYLGPRGGWRLPGEFRTGDVGA
jgi:hypothetical protein